MSALYRADAHGNIRIGAGVVLLLAAGAVAAQTVLPGVDVRAPKWEERHGGYVISSNFEVDPKMSAVIYPAEAFQKDDIVSVRLTQMKDDEYFVLQECISSDCTQAHIVRAWNAYGALGVTAHNDDRVWIPHEGKFFMWMQRFPMSGFRTGPFTGYEPLGPPLVLNPTGTAAQFRACDVKAAQERGPVKVLSSAHDGSSFVLRFEGGTSILIQRMHAAE
ncbi:MAG TPA: hypothetical protein VGH81_08680 [Rudaea sp.]|jgi:hypothetical protein